MSNQGEAIAGSSAMIFTATDRQLIEERAGEINPDQNFMEIMKKQPLTPEVENEESTIKPEPDTKELQGRVQDHRSMLKHSILYVPHEQVEIRNQLPDTYEKKKKPVVKSGLDKFSKNNNPATVGNPVLEQGIEADPHQETVAIVKELKLDPNEVLKKFSLEQKELLGLIKRIKDLHLKRLLAERPEEFAIFSEEIKRETLGRSKPEAQAWLEAKLDQLTLESAKYKLGILQSLQSIELNDQRKKNIKWLKKVVAQLTKS